MAHTAKRQHNNLSSADASIAKAMLARGDRPQDIAAWFGVGDKCITSIARGKMHAHVAEAPIDELPPEGRCIAGRDAQLAVSALREAAKTIKAALNLIRDRPDPSA
jgi:hypothetical protein